MLADIKNAYYVWLIIEVYQLLMNIRCYLFIFSVLSSLFSYSQIPDSSSNISSQLPGKYYSKVDKKISSVNEQLTKKSLKYLAKFQRQEERLMQKIGKLNPENANNILNLASEKYKGFSQKIKSKTAGVTKIMSGEYNLTLTAWAPRFLS